MRNRAQLTDDDYAFIVIIHTITHRRRISSVEVRLFISRLMHAHDTITTIKPRTFAYFIDR